MTHNVDSTTNSPNDANVIYLTGWDSSVIIKSSKRSFDGADLSDKYGSNNKRR